MNPSQSELTFQKSWIAEICRVCRGSRYQWWLSATIVEWPGCGTFEASSRTARRGLRFRVGITCLAGVRQAHKSCRVKWSGMACGLVVSLTGTRESKVAKHDWWKKPLFHPFLDDATISCLDVTLKSWWWLLQGQSFRRGKLSALFGVAWKCMNEKCLRSPLWSSPSTSKSSHCQWILLLQLSNWHIILLYFIQPNTWRKLQNSCVSHSSRLLSKHLVPALSTWLIQVQQRQ